MMACRCQVKAMEDAGYSLKKVKRSWEREDYGGERGIRVGILQPRIPTSRHVTLVDLYLI